MIPAATIRRQEAQQQQEVPAAPAAVTPPAPAEKPAPGDQHIGGFETLDDDDAIIESIRKEARDAKPEPAPAKPAVKAKKAPVDAKAHAPDSPAPKAGSFETPTAALDAVTRAFEAGDIDTLAKLTGKPKSFFQLNDAKWGAFRQEQAETRRLATDTKQAQQKLQADKAAAKAEFGDAINAAVAYRDGDFEKFATLVEKLSGESYDVAQRKVIEGHIALDAPTKALRKQLAAQQLQIEELKKPKPAEVAKEPTPVERKAAYDRAVGEVTNELAGHAVSKVSGFQNLVLQKVKDSWSAADETYTMSFEDAADSVIEDRRAEAEALGFAAKHPALSGRPRKTEPTIPSRSRAADARVADGEPWMTQDLDDDEIIASLERDRKAGRLR